MEKFIESLKNPPKEYRPVPFWSWNDKLEPEMLRWQIREMEKAGLGGYFMHARGGLQTEYMSEEWMDCTQVCIDEGKKTGMNSWCYDEEGWPSGFAGGIVPAMGEKFHMRWIELEEIDTDNAGLDENILALYSWDKESNVLSRVQLETAKAGISVGTKFFAIRQKTNPYYIDILNKEVIKAFIEVTHEKYFKLFGDEFGKGMLGFFTDEPQYARDHIPYSIIVPDEFKSRWGYDVMDLLPALFIECEGYEKFRYDYWSLMSDLYCKSFGQQIYEWCEEHNCKLTGHSIQEDNFISQMYCSAGVMPFYEYMHIPGMDWLCRRIDSPVIPKQVSSVANQLGKKFVLSETFALCGWNVSFEELKWIAEWQFVNGVNFLCQHLESYTIRGLRKRDYPPSLFYQQPWWEEYRLFNDYFSRLGMLLTSGKNVSEVLLLHPIKSAWIAYNFKNNDILEKLNRDFVWATELLAGLHIAHEYGDETIIGKYGRVEGDKFVIGQCEYRLVVMPSMHTLDAGTTELLEQFTNNGGKVVSIGDFPLFVNGRADLKLQALKNSVINTNDEEDIYKVFKNMDLVSIKVEENKKHAVSIHYQQRNLGETKVFYLVNINNKETFETVITLSGKGIPSRYSAEDSSLKEIEYMYQGDNTILKLEFLPMQSYVIIFELQEERAPKLMEKNIQLVKPNTKWSIEEADMNSLTLDYCSYRIENGEWQGPIHTIKLMDILLKFQKECDIELKFNFEVNMDLNKVMDLFLAIETANEFTITVNGSLYKFKESGWWKDSSFKKVNIKDFVVNGINEVILKRRFYQSQKVYDVLFGENVLETEKNKLTYDVELESIYVIGDFGLVSKSGYIDGEGKALFTDGPFVLTDKPVKVVSGDLTQQGFCFFAGKIKLSQNIEISKNENDKYILDFGVPDAVITKLFINDRLVRSMPWAPYKVDITEYIQEGTNKLALQLFSGNRNLLGPHHHKDGELYAVGPSSFTDQAGWEGNTGEMIWKDRYCFVRFGISG